MAKFTLRSLSSHVLMIIIWTFYIKLHNIRNWCVWLGVPNVINFRILLHLEYFSQFFFLSSVVCSSSLSLCVCLVFVYLFIQFHYCVTKVNMNIIRRITWKDERCSILFLFVSITLLVYTFGFNLRNSRSLGIQSLRLLFDMQQVMWRTILLLMLLSEFFGIVCTHNLSETR